MSLKKTVYRELMAGKMICRISNPAGFDLLTDPDGIRDVEKVLEPFGVRVAITSRRHAFFAAEDSVEAGSKLLRESRDHMAREARRIEELTEFMLNVYPDGERIQLGTVIGALDVLGIINGSNALMEQLATLTAGQNMTSNTTAKRVTNLFAGLARDGYLKTLSAEQETYQVTGQIEYIWDVIENFARLIPDVAAQLQEEPDDRQGVLFP